MTDKTAIEKSPCQWCQNSFYFTHGSNIMKEPCFSCVDTDNWGSFVFSGKDGHKAFAAIEAEKPDEHDIEKLVEDICEPGSTLWSGETSDLDGEWIIYPDNEAIGDAIKSYAESYHAEQCKACKK